MSLPRTPATISLVVPNYNYARYVGEAIGSMLSQSVPPSELEVIVIDDASTDDSWTVLQRYAGDPRVVLVRHATNRGYVESYNEGFELSRGRYLVSLDADDFALDPDALRVQAELLDEEPDVGLVFSDHVVIDDCDRLIGYKRARVPVRLRHPDGFRRLLRRNFITHSGAMFRRACLEQVGRHDSRFLHNMDWELWLRISTKWDLARIPRPLYAYRMHDRSMHRSVDSELGIRALREVLDHAATYSPLPDTAAIVRRGVADGFVMRAGIHLAAGRFSSAMSDLASALHQDKAALLSANLLRGLGHLALRATLGARKERFVQHIRRWMYRRAAGAAVPRGGYRR